MILFEHSNTYLINMAFKYIGETVKTIIKFLPGPNTVLWSSSEYNEEGAWAMYILEDTYETSPDACYKTTRHSVLPFFKKISD